MDDIHVLLIELEVESSIMTVYALCEQV